MARINTYKTDLDVRDLDKWIGTDSSTGKTRNFTSQGIADNFNKTGKIAIGSQVPFLFFSGGIVSRPNGTITFPNGGGNLTDFSTVTELVLSKNTSANIYVGDYLEYLNEGVIFINSVSDPNVFAKYAVTSSVQNALEPNFYNLVVSFMGGNGYFESETYYTLSESSEKERDKNFEYNQLSPSASWSITHDLLKFPSVTVLDSSGNTVFGDILYNDNRTLTLTFSAAFTGTAYLN